MQMALLSFRWIQALGCSQVDEFSVVFLWFASGSGFIFDELNGCVRPFDYWLNDRVGSGQVGGIERE